MLSKIFAPILFFILAFLSFSSLTENKYLDITQNKINSLSPDTTTLLSKIDDSLIIRVYSPNISELSVYNILLAQYKQHSSLINTELHQTENQRVVTVDYKHQQKSLTLETFDLSEQQISGLIQKSIGLASENGALLVFKHATPKDLNYQQTNVNSFLYNYGFIILLPLFLICIGFYLEPR